MIKNRFFILALATLLLAGGLVLSVAQRGVPSVIQTNLENLPMEIGGYKGSEDQFPQYVYDVLQADQHVYRHYTSPEGKELSLYIGYYGTAKGGRTGHNPYACLPGAGWTIVERGEVTVKPSYRPEGVRLNYVVARKGDVNNVMLHWYQSGGTKILTSGLQQNMDRFLGRVLHNRNDGAFVQVYGFVGEPEVPQTKERVGALAVKVLELLPGVWPVEG